MMTKRIFPWVLTVSKRLLRQIPTIDRPPFLSQYDRAVLRSALAFTGTAPAVFTNENIRGVLGADQACMTCPRSSAGQGRIDDGKICQESRCDECGWPSAKST
jgi:hypothetical protein